MVLQDRLDLGGGNTVAFVFDGIHGPVYKEKVAVTIHGHDIRRPIPFFPVQFDEGFGRLFGFIEIAVHHVFGRDDQFAGIPRFYRF